MANNPPVNTLGNFTNPAGSTISGTSYGVELGGAGSVLNLGSIDASEGTGVIVDGVGFVTNAAAGIVTGSINGVYTDGAGNIYNSGIISGETGSGAYVKGVGLITNYSNAVLSGSAFGLDVAGAATVENLGSIYGSGGTGIFATGVGIISNSVDGIISGSSFGLDLFESAGTVTNDGTISSSEGGAAYIGGVGTLTNSAAIRGALFGVEINAAGTVLNSGTVSSTEGFGVSITGVGYVSNSSTAAISGSSYGVHILAGGTVENAGQLSAANGEGVLISQAGDVTNASTGQISGATFGVDIGGAGTVINSGTVASSEGTGISIFAAGGVTNLAGGTITGATYGVNMFGVASVENAGLIAGSTGTLGGAVVFQQATGDLVVDSGAVFQGNVEDVGGGGVIELTAGSLASTGTLDMGASFSGFSTINFDESSAWLLKGDESALTSQVINGFSSGDTIVLEGFTETSDTYVSGVGLELFGADGVPAETIDITGSFDTSSFTVFNVPGGTEIVICYLHGTRILTPSGDVNVESLKIGDRLVTRWQGIQPIKWIGRQSFASRFVKDNQDIVPVRIAAGALGEGLPLRDLFVSPAHSMLVDNTLVLAKSLVNGLTITQDATPDEIHYYLIEFEAHDCVLAEGTWSESFADFPGLRDKFQNAANFYELYPDYRAPEELSLCAPRPERGAKLDAVLRPVVARASASTTTGPLKGWIENVGGPWKIHGWAQDEGNPELPVLLDVLIKDRLIGTVLACDYRGDLAEAGIGRGKCSFIFTSPVNLTTDVKGEIRVRRTSDHAEILMTPECRGEISHDLPKARLLQSVG